MSDQQGKSDGSGLFDGLPTYPTDAPARSDSRFCYLCGKPAYCGCMKCGAPCCASHIASEIPYSSVRKCWRCAGYSWGNVVFAIVAAVILLFCLLPKK